MRRDYAVNYGLLYTKKLSRAHYLIHNNKIELKSSADSLSFEFTYKYIPSGSNNLPNVGSFLVK